MGHAAEGSSEIFLPQPDLLFLCHKQKKTPTAIREGPIR
jgi:hypothetical protein